MTIRLSRGGGGYGGYAQSLVIDDDGTFAMDLDAGRRAGHYAGTVAGDDLRRVRELAAAAAEATEDPASAGDDPITPESAADAVEVDGAGRSFGVWDEPEGPWGELRTFLRELMAKLLDEPLRALEIEAGQATPSAVIRHAGSEPVRLGGGTIDAKATLTDASSNAIASWQHQVEVDEGEVGPGWELDLGLDAGAFELQAGTSYRVSAAVVVVADQGGRNTWTLHGSGGEGWTE